LRDIGYLPLDAMTLVQIERNRRRVEIAGSLVSALVIGTIVWIMSQPSIGSTSPREPLWIIVCILTAGCCYLSVYWLLDRYQPLHIKKFRLNWIVISLAGTTLAFVTLTSPSWLRHGSLTQEYLLPMLSLLSFFNLMMFGVMALVSSLGFIVSVALKEIEEARVVLD